MTTTRRPAGYQMSDEEAARVRSQVPDDPIPRPEATVPCECCGVAVPDPDPPLRDERARIAEGLGPYWQHPYQGRYGLCETCQGIRERAAAYVYAHPLLARQIGPQLAQERIEGVLHGLALLGRDVDVDLGLLLPRMHPATHSLGYRTPDCSTSARCNPHPWAHVTMTQRANLRQAYATVLADSITLRKPPVLIPCPTLACLYCGVASLAVAAVSIDQLGLDGAQARVWRPLDASEEALGGRVRPHPLRGHVCPDCADAIDAVGSVGFTSRSRAVLACVEHTSKERADRLRLMLSDEYPPALIAWRALPTPRVPNAEPWAHLRLERL